MTEPAPLSPVEEFFTAIQNAEHDKVRGLLKKEPPLLEAFHDAFYGATPLNVAVQFQDKEMIDLLLDAGADVERKSDWSEGPWSALQLALAFRHIDLAEHLVERGAKIDAHAAAGLGRIDILEGLLKENPEWVHERGGDGCFPLHFAATPEVCDLLLDFGADIDGRDIDHNSTPAQYALYQRGPVARHLITRGAEPDIFLAAHTGDTMLTRRLLIENPEVVNERITMERFPAPDSDAERWCIYAHYIGMNATPLHAAAAGNRPHEAILLLAAGCDVNATGGYDDASPLHVCAWNNHVACAESLIAGGAAIDQTSGEIHQNTSLGWAVVAGAVEMVELLLKRGAEKKDYFIKDARTGLAGAFREYTVVPLERYQAIIDLLDS